jgi:hypothetical protein
LFFKKLSEKNLHFKEHPYFLKKKSKYPDFLPKPSTSHALKRGEFVGKYGLGFFACYNSHKIKKK